MIVVRGLAKRVYRERVRNRSDCFETWPQYSRKSARVEFHGATEASDTLKHMPASVLDLVEAVLELLDVLVYWRFWLPILLAAAVAILISEAVQDAALRWFLIVPIMAAGVVSGWMWQRKKD